MPLDLEVIEATRELEAKAKRELQWVEEAQLLPRTEVPALDSSSQPKTRDKTAIVSPHHNRSSATPKASPPPQFHNNQKPRFNRKKHSNKPLAEDEVDDMAAQRSTSIPPHLRKNVKMGSVYIPPHLRNRNAAPVEPKPDVFLGDLIGAVPPPASLKSQHEEVPMPDAKLGDLIGVEPSKASVKSQHEESAPNQISS